ncbi:branched-chain amino acid aminotransferase [Bacillus sp. BRMEA1]|uniref:branched-chain amino acid aminotransferase n=1 Tax=Neobacillus endophyticus TaxID=2738405 RepID=UPI001563926D|nr:branched-chain amino acid aminotransferase [Neobacillus endophyticus]NRD79652.1 branched-chain amino acid aminotransferase [Neobacillus endophyticus]
MLKERILEYIHDYSEQNGENIALFPEEKEYAQKHELLDVPLVDMEANLRFSDAYIERCDKETENMIRIESSDFLTQPLVYLHKRQNEFIYIESKWFDIVQVEAISLELDDVFKTYDVMLGLKLQKKFSASIREYLQSHLNGENANFDLIFSNDDGLWNLNFALNDLNGFDENMTIGEGYQLIYRFLFEMIAELEK